MRVLSQAWYEFRDAIATYGRDHTISEARNGEGVAKTLVLSLLWAALEPSANFTNDLIPNELRQRILHAYTATGGLITVNPVERVGFHVSGEGAELHLIELRDAEHPAAETESPNGVTANFARHEFAAVHS